MHPAHMMFGSDGLNLKQRISSGASNSNYKKKKNKKCSSLIYLCRKIFENRDNRSKKGEDKFLEKDERTLSQNEFTPNTGEFKSPRQ